MKYLTYRIKSKCNYIFREMMQHTKKYNRVNSRKYSNIKISELIFDYVHAY